MGAFKPFDAYRGGSPHGLAGLLGYSETTKAPPLSDTSLRFQLQLVTAFGLSLLALYAAATPYLAL